MNETLTTLLVLPMILFLWGVLIVAFDMVFLDELITTKVRAWVNRRVDND